MFNFNKNKVVKKANHFDSLIAPGMTVYGSITFGGTVRICGHLDGALTGKRDDTNKAVKSYKTIAVIEEGGCVECDIEADHVIVHGEIRGNITAKTVYIAATAKINVANTVITYDFLQIEPGASIRDAKFTDTKFQKVEFELIKDNAVVEEVAA